MKTERVTVGPFIWQRNDDGKDECWDLVMPHSAPLPLFSVKNYGGKPSAQPFSGWRLVGGGPFNEAGGWTSRDAAMAGVVPYLLRYYRDHATAVLAKMRLQQAAMKGWLTRIGA